MRAWMLCVVALVSVCGSAFGAITAKNESGQDVPVKAGTYVGTVTRVAVRSQVTYYLHSRKGNNPTGDDCWLIMPAGEFSFSAEEKEMLDEGDRENDGDNFADITVPSAGSAEVNSTGTGPRAP